jgi:methylglyoxal reductase
MLKRPIGSSGIEASAVGLGAWAIGGWMWGGSDEQTAINAIHTALDHGITLIDTAPIYGFGRSEEITGRAIKDRRDKVVLATKCGLVWHMEKGKFHFFADDEGITPMFSKRKVYRYLHPDSIREEVEKSLRRLQTETIDLCQTHWQDPTTPIADTMDALLKLKEEGKIRAIGVSNAKLEHLKAYGDIDSDQEQYSMLDRKIEKNGMLDYCRNHSIAVLAYSPLVLGLLTGRLDPNRQYGAKDLRLNNKRFTPENVRHVNQILARFKPLTEKYTCTIAQLVIAWTFQQQGITHVLCGARKPEQAIENAGAGAVSLSKEDIGRIDETIKSDLLS